MKAIVYFDKMTGELQYFDADLQVVKTLDCCQPTYNEYEVDCSPMNCSTPPAGTNYGFSIKTVDTITAGDKIITYNYPTAGVKLCWTVNGVLTYGNVEPLQLANEIIDCTPC